MLAASYTIVSILLFAGAVLGTAMAVGISLAYKAFDRGPQDL